MNSFLMEHLFNLGITVTSLVEIQINEHKFP